MIRRFYVRLEPGEDRVEVSLDAVQRYDFYQAQWKTGGRPPGTPQEAFASLDEDIKIYTDAMEDATSEEYRERYREKVELLKNTKIIMIRMESTNHIMERQGDELVISEDNR